MIILSFIAGFMLDVVWALCVHAISKRRPIMAANMSVLIYLFALVSTIMIVDKNITAIVAYAIGGWIGTYVTVVVEKKHVRKNS